MKQLLGYIRVSTARQGTQGVSLQEQRDAITRYAERNGFAITAWFEERETAAKRGRPVFNDVLKRLRRGEAHGIVVHKIDRSARNLKDWADLGELIDQGIEVHFANESLDLHSRGGRLSADIQAVVAADYIRNLREETKKGFYGRIKQGFLPLPAPVGYLDMGKGKPKALDPAKAPLVRKAFELYATGAYSLHTLADELWRQGLRNKRGRKLSVNGLSIVLNNPFYLGLIRLKRTGETFPGVHQPLVSASLFQSVQRVLDGKTPNRVQRHGHLFRRLLTCRSCSYSLIGERQKGHVYYRCHTRGCPTTCIREETADAAIATALMPLNFTDRERRYLAAKVVRMRTRWVTDREDLRRNLELRRVHMEERLTRITDAYLDGLIDKDHFERSKANLLFERRAVEDQLRALNGETLTIPENVAGFIELAGSASVQYKTALPEEKRDLVRIVTSNRVVHARNVDVTLAPPFHLVAKGEAVTSGAPYRDVPRTLDRFVENLWDWFKANLAVSFPTASTVSSKDSARAEPSKGAKVAGRGKYQSDN